ncbi:MAG: hypothetical protein IJE97_08165, partial [Thermoguttaceae bacterium]|nr:hypothetical protein [Thermoguttaceae bacterium]
RDSATECASRTVGAGGGRIRKAFDDNVLRFKRKAEGRNASRRRKLKPKKFSGANLIFVADEVE